VFAVARRRSAEPLAERMTGKNWTSSEGRKEKAAKGQVWIADDRRKSMADGYRWNVRWTVPLSAVSVLVV
jgi:hypothetical protein